MTEVEIYNSCVGKPTEVTNLSVDSFISLVRYIGLNIPLSGNCRACIEQYSATGVVDKYDLNLAVNELVEYCSLVQYSRDVQTNNMF